MDVLLRKKLWAKTTELKHMATAYRLRKK